MCKRFIYVNTISHVDCHEKVINDNIRRFCPGSYYKVNSFFDNFPKDDVVKRYWFSDICLCVAKYDVWENGFGSYIRDPNEILFYYGERLTFDKEHNIFYNRPNIDICLMNGKVITKYFDTDNEMHNYVQNTLFVDGLKKIEL